MPAIDPHMDPPGTTGTWQPLGFDPVPDLAAAGSGYAYELARGEQTMDMPDRAIHEIQHTYTAQFEPDAGSAEYVAARDGHRLNVRARVTALLALLEHRRTVTEDDWDVAGAILSASDIGRSICERALRREARQRVQTKADEHSQIELTREDASEQHRYDQRERVRDRVATVLRDKPGLKRAEIRLQMPVRHRAYFAEVFAEMVDDGEVVPEDVTTEAGQTTRRHWLAE